MCDRVPINVNELFGVVFMSIGRFKNMLIWCAIGMVLSPVVSAETFRLVSVIHPKDYPLTFGGFHIGSAIVSESEVDILPTKLTFALQFNISGSAKSPEEIKQISEKYYKFPEFLESGGSRLIHGGTQMISIDFEPLDNGVSDEDPYFEGSFRFEGNTEQFTGLTGACDYTWTVQPENFALMRANCKTN